MISNHSDIVLYEGHPRGFLSNYLTILTAFHYFEKLGINDSSIKISSSMFSLYGNPCNWFESSKVVSRTTGVAVDATMTHTTSTWSAEELSSSKTIIPFRLLSKYVDNFSPNQRIIELLKSFELPPKCLGVHYRGTDHINAHSHSKPVSMNMFLKSIDEELEQGEYDNLFLATDEQSAVSVITEHCEKKHGITPKVNNFIRSSSVTPIHKLPLDSAEKIRIGDEVITDASCLSRCASVICRDSNIINYATVLNPSLRTNYLDI